MLASLYIFFICLPVSKHCFSFFYLSVIFCVLCFLFRNKHYINASLKLKGRKPSFSIMSKRKLAVNTLCNLLSAIGDKVIEGQNSIKQIYHMFLLQKKGLHLLHPYLTNLFNVCFYKSVLVQCMFLFVVFSYITKCLGGYTNMFIVFQLFFLHVFFYLPSLISKLYAY